MGQEAACTFRMGKKVSRGTALLESTELIFRGESRLVIPFREMQLVKAVDGELRVKFRGSLARFQVGSRAEKWAQKILHPPGQPAGAIWIVYPKGRTEITENDVLSTGRVVGLKDVKVCSFSATHTALKFVIPVSLRS